MRSTIRSAPPSARSRASASDGAQVIFVDMHAETTSEKIALSYYLDGKVAAVIGTHTHVQTADERILAGGTACLTDVGMTGPHDGVIGIDKDAIIAQVHVTGLPARFETASGDPRLNGVVITVDASTGRATAIERLSLTEDELKESRTASRAGREHELGFRSMTNRTSKSSKVPAVPRCAGSKVPPVSQRCAQFQPLDCANSNGPDGQRAERDDSRSARKPTARTSGSKARFRTRGCGIPATCTSR